MASHAVCKDYGSKALEWKEEDVLSYTDRQGIATQMLSGIPLQYEVRISNDYGASLVKQQPLHFGLLAALPTDNPETAMAEVVRAISDLGADGLCCHNLLQ
jgi:6-methylsalicylate decarboxylase